MPSPTAPAAVQQSEVPDGLRPLGAWSTEVVLPTGGTSSPWAAAPYAPTWCSPHPSTTAEVDNGTEGPPIVLDKIERYVRFSARRATLSGRELPLWRTVWPASPRDGGVVC